MNDDTDLNPAAELVRAVGNLLKDLAGNPATPASVLAQLSSASQFGVTLELRPQLQISICGTGPTGAFAHTCPIHIEHRASELN